MEPGVRSTQKACVEVLGLHSEGATILVLSFLAAKEKGETGQVRSSQCACGKRRLGEESLECAPCEDVILKRP